MLTRYFIDGNGNTSILSRLYSLFLSFTFEQPGVPCSLVVPPPTFLSLGTSSLCFACPPNSRIISIDSVYSSTIHCKHWIPKLSISEIWQTYLTSALSLKVNIYISCTPWSMRGPTPADVVKAKPVCGWARQIPMPRNIEAKSGIPEGEKFETQQNWIKVKTTKKK